MDELIRIKKDELKKITAGIGEAMSLPYNDVARDSALLRFELASEISWKLLKVVLEKRFKVIQTFPSGVYREAGRVGLLGLPDVETSLQMVDDRNRMVHDYNPDWAEKLFSRIKDQYASLLERIANI